VLDAGMPFPRFFLAVTLRGTTSAFLLTREDYLETSMQVRESIQQEDRMGKS
jgi:hypothetical protein